MKRAGAVSLKARLAAALGAVPPGRVVGYGTLAAHLDCAPPLVVRMITALAPVERESLPWHRVVADGGAIGRHRWREEQIARLAMEGVVVSPAGIVQDVARFRIAEVGVALERGGQPLQLPGEPAVPPASGGAPLSRARGRLARPSSTVGRK